MLRDLEIQLQFPVLLSSESASSACQPCAQSGSNSEDGQSVVGAIDFMVFWFSSSPCLFATKQKNHSPKIFPKIECLKFGLQ